MKPNVISSGSVGGTSGIFALNRWLRQMGVTPITGWRWRENGWLTTINICGRVYISAEAIDEFTRRAKAGEFACLHTVPRRSGKSIGHDPQ